MLMRDLGSGQIGRLRRLALVLGLLTGFAGFLLYHLSLG